MWLFACVVVCVVVERLFGWWWCGGCVVVCSPSSMGSEKYWKKDCFGSSLVIVRTWPCKSRYHRVCVIIRGGMRGCVLS